MKREPGTGSPGILSRAGSSIPRASRLSRSGDRLIKRICASSDTLEKALALYDSLKDTDLYSKDGVPIVCAYIASEILGNGDVTREPAEAAAALGEVEFMERLQEVRKVLGSSMATVSYKSLILTSKLSNRDGLDTLMQAVENVLVIPENLTCSRDTVILAVFHWTCNYLQAMSTRPKDEVLIENFDIDGITFEALLDALTSTVKNMPLLQTWKETQSDPTELPPTPNSQPRVSISATQELSTSPVPQPPSRGQKRKHASVDQPFEVPPPPNSQSPPTTRQLPTLPSFQSRVMSLIVPPLANGNTQTVLRIPRSSSSTRSTSSTLAPSEPHAYAPTGALQLSISGPRDRRSGHIPRLNIPQAQGANDAPMQSSAEQNLHSPKRIRLPLAESAAGPPPVNQTPGLGGSSLAPLLQVGVAYPRLLSIDTSPEIKDRVVVHHSRGNSPSGELHRHPKVSPSTNMVNLSAIASGSHRPAPFVSRQASRVHSRVNSPAVEARSESDQDLEAVDQVQLQLARLVHKATWDVVNYVDNIGCSDVTLKLKILDLKTRMVELVKAGGSGAQNDVTKMLHESIRRRQEDIVRYGIENTCGEINLKLKILDLNTRLSVMLGRTLAIVEAEE